ncbi:MAG TPA: tetratricopeptide repeat protein [Pyrinomonadaceae bacterium]|nr:tetratricopeptide repeat protein [Pyrinomonadaceae bacterium]
MKRCPECRRDYYDGTLLYCLDDGAPLLEGPASADDPATAILSEPGAVPTGSLPSEAPTRTLDPYSDPAGSVQIPSQASARNTVIAVGIGAVLVATLGIGAYLYYNRGSSKQIESIAVMPFVNESGNPDVEYLSDGMTETLISNLSQIPNLDVKARSSVFRYKGKDMGPQTIGKELNVQGVLNGRVVQRGNDVTLYIELVEPATEKVLWKTDYTRPLTDLVPMQRDIARDVSDRLRVKLSGSDAQRLARNYTENTEAYQLYLKGRYQWNKRTKESLKRAVEYFNQAIEKDPSFALAYAGLADCYVVFSSYGVESPADAFPKARMAAQKALEIDGTLGEAWATLAQVKWSYDWDFMGAERDFQRAIELDPNYPTAHQWYGEFLETMGRFDESLAEMRRAQELDPLSLIISKELGTALLFARRYDVAIMQLKKVLEMDENFASAHFDLGYCYLMKGMYDESIAEFQKARAITNDGSFQLSGLASALVKVGNRQEARKILQQLSERKQREYVDPQFLAAIYAALGEKENAFANLEEAYNERSDYIPILKVSPAYDDEFRSDPRFQDLLRRVGLPQ